MGHILLEGGGEFQGRMDSADKRAIEMAGGPNARISIIPAAAAPDHNHARAGANGVRWFHKLGVRHARVLPVINRASANDPALADELRKSDLIFLLGGFPAYLAETLIDSLCWEATLKAHQSGAFVAGSSAGAMVLCEFFYNPAGKHIQPGLNLVPRVCVLPHHETFGHTWVSHVRHQLPRCILIGIDEETGMLTTGKGNAWQVFGKGRVTLYRDRRPERFTIDQTVTL